MGIFTLTANRGQKAGKPPKCRGGFSLLELLVVTALIVGITSIVVPSVTDSLFSSSLRASGDQLIAAVNFARQNSVAKKGMTALILVDDGGPSGNFSTYALYEIAPDDDGAALTSGDWKPLGKWESFPTGIIIDKSTLTPKSAQNVVPALPPISLKGVDLTDYQSIIFLPGGSLLDHSSVYLRIVKGIWQNGGVKYTSAISDSGEPLDYYAMTILPATGRVKVERP